MHQNLAVILRQFIYGKNSFIVLIPGNLAIGMELKLKTWARIFVPDQKKENIEETIKGRIFTVADCLNASHSFEMQIAAYHLPR